MSTQGFYRKIKPLTILSDEDLEAIHKGTLEALENTGVKVEHERARKILKDGGCLVDDDSQRVRIPPALVEECIRKAPSSFHVKARDSRKDVEIGGNTTYFSAFPGRGIVDADTWESRTATKKENADGVKILDALDSVHILSPYTPYFGAKDIPPVMAIPESCAAKIRGSSKPQIEGHAEDSEIFEIDMAKAVGTEIIGAFQAAPPMTFRNADVEAAFRWVEAGLPIYLSGGGLIGSTLPATIAGAVIVNNAQDLAGLVLVQLIKPGSRVLIVDFVFPQEMRTGVPVFGSIESCLHAAASNQLWRKYGIPVFNTWPGPTNSKKIGFQAGYEKAFGAIFCTLTGANLLLFHGGVYGEISFHPLQAILDDDIAGMIGRFLKGIDVNDETLAIDLISEVGPIPGMYLDKKHTREWWKREQFLPKAADRLSYPDWEEKGKKNDIDYAKERMEEILATHEPTPLTPSQEEEIGKILSEAERYYKKQGKI